MFSLEGVNLRDFTEVGLLKNLYTLMSTEEHSYNELSNEISLYTGGIGASTNLFSRMNTGEVMEHFVLSAR